MSVRKVRAIHSAKYRPIPRVLVAMRNDMGLTQRKLAKRMRKPQPWVCDCEKAGRRVDLAEFVSWAKACDIDPHDALQRYLDQL